MRLWTIQPASVEKEIRDNGAYICDEKDKGFYEGFLPYYAWLENEMSKKIGNPPKGVTHPVWAWTKKPDLRRVRWTCSGDFVCIEAEIPDSEAVLTDYYLWGMMLMDNPVTYSEKEQEDWESLRRRNKREAEKIKTESWQRVFSVGFPSDPSVTEWSGKGSCTQATFWTLKANQVRKIRRFRGAERL